MTRNQSVIPREIFHKYGSYPEESFGFFLGISNFEDDQLPSIKFAVDDAVDLAWVFSLHLGLIDPKRCTVAILGEPTKEESRRRLDELIRAGATQGSPRIREVYRLPRMMSRSMVSKGTFIVSASTHGLSEDGSDYFLASDSLRENPKRTGIDANEFINSIATSDAPRKIILLDVCRESIDRNVRAIDFERENKFAEIFAQTRGMAILSASSMGGFAYDDDTRHNGVFSGAIVEGLLGAASADSQGFITLNTLAKFVNDRVRSWILKNRPHHQDRSRGIEIRVDEEIGELPLALALERTAENTAVNSKGKLSPDKQVKPEPLGSATFERRSTFHNDSFDSKDCLRFRERVIPFAKLLAAQDVRPPISIGIFGHWGAGKSYFMQVLHKEIAALVGRNSSYIRRVCQIQFNAWHYSDAHLWSGLALRIFDGLAHDLAGTNQTQPRAKAYLEARQNLRSQVSSSFLAKAEAEASRSQAEKALQEEQVKIEQLRIQRKDMRMDLEKKLWNRLARQEAVKELLSQLGNQLERLGLPAALDSVQQLHDVSTELSKSRSRLKRLFMAAATLFSGEWAIVKGILMVAGLLIVLLLVQNVVRHIPSLAESAKPISWLAGMVASASSIWSWCRGRLKDFDKAASTVERIKEEAAFKACEAMRPKDEELGKELESLYRIEAKIQSAEQAIGSAAVQIAEAKRELLRIDSGGLVYDFLHERASSDPYRAHIGLISVIRQDLEALQQLISTWKQTVEGPRGTVDRIILYVDDLDRCAPQKVVEVLQAVHLLLAFDLFSVVVAVDSRWLEASLNQVYSARDRQEFSALNYLEKIFQIPYSLPPMEVEDFGRLVEHVAGVPFSLIDEKPLLGQRAEAPLPDSPTNSSKMGESRIGSQVDGIDPEQNGKPDADSTLVFEVEQGSPPQALSDQEIQFLQDLQGLIETPRLTKRLVNIYRLLRVQVPSNQLEAFISQEARVVVGLLAIQVGRPLIANRFFDWLSGLPPEWKEADLGTLAQAPRATQEFCDISERARITDARLKLALRWVGEVERFTLMPRKREVFKVVRLAVNKRK